MNKLSDSFIKVHYVFPAPWQGGPGSESMWAQRVSDDTARINNIPFSTGMIACGDLVRINKDNEIVEVLEHVAQTWVLIYDSDRAPTREQATERYAEVRKYLEKYGIEAESMLPGICSISVPLNFDESKLAQIAAEVKAELRRMPDAENSDCLRLKTELLSLGGTGVVWPDADLDLRDLLERGQLLDMKVKLKLKPMGANQSHYNVAALWERDVDGIRICTGYGLSDDGLWRQHSWAMKGKSLIETTVKRNQYFGVCLEDREALDFWRDNLMVFEPRMEDAALKRLEANPKLMALFMKTVP